VAAGTQGQIIANTDPFAEPANDPKPGQGRQRGPKRPRAKVASVRGPTRRALHEHRGRVLIRFYSVGRARGFLCRFDRQRHFKRCRSPKRYRVAPGKHVFWVRAIGMTGLRGPVAHEDIDIPPFCQGPNGPKFPSRPNFEGTICTR
jgi:hypothetical protein